MYHIRLIKGISYSGAVTATRKKPDVFTEDEVIYQSAMDSGYFADLTSPAPAKELQQKDDRMECENADEPIEKQSVDNLFSDMNLEELKEYAEGNGISLTGAKKKSEILSVIRCAESKAAEARSLLRER